MIFSGQEFERTWCSEQHAILMSTGCSPLQLLAESGVWPDRCFFVYLQRFFLLGSQRSKLFHGSMADRCFFVSLSVTFLLLGSQISKCFIDG